MKDNLLYSQLTDIIAHQIRNGVLKAGERLPSVRMLSKQHNVSINTSKRVFLELEAQSLIESKPQSGYFVSAFPSVKLPLPNTSKTATSTNNIEPNELISRVYENLGKENLTLFSIGVPSGNLLPLAKLKKEINQATRTLHDGGAGYEPLAGNATLRRMIAARSIHWKGNLKEEDLITTTGGMNSLALCLMALTKPGDTIALESPCYPGILQLAVSMGLKVLEVATHPDTGIDIEALKKVIPRINICLLVPNFNTPLGSCMPDKHKQEIVTLLNKHDIPLIEDDVYGDLYFGNKRSVCCKTFDKTGNVLWCGSVSKTLAPGYRVGWIAPGRYKEQILKLKLVHSISSISIVNEAVGSFLKSGKYDNHLRQLRRTLQENAQHYTLAIAEYFPEGTKISRPHGGLALWVEFSKKTDVAELYDLALKKNISISPGRMFTLQNRFHNCMRLCIGLPWSDELRQKLKQIGTLAKMLSKQ